MNNKSSPNSANKLDILKWILFLVLVAGAVVGNQKFGNQPFIYRLLGLLTVGALAAAVFFATEKGSNVLSFCKDSLVELRKVVWPSRDETVKSTVIIMIAVTVVALMLWLMDNLILSLIVWLTGLGSA